MHAGSTRTASALLVALSLLAPPCASAQAWLPPQGEGSVSVLYSNTFVEKHYLPTIRYDLGHISSHTLVAEIAYSPSDRTAISVSLPLVLARYVGNNPHQAANQHRIDDGTYHGTFSDFHFNIRRGFRAGRVAFAPFAGVVLPSHRYEFWAHAAPGRRLREAVAGISAATLLDDITPGLFIQADYSFAFAQRVLDVRPNHSNLQVEVGYFVTDALRVVVAGSGQLMHDGVDVWPAEISRVRLTQAQIQHHDQIGRENNLNVATAVSYSVRDGVDVFASLMKQLAGRNGHQIDRTLSAGVTLRFRRGKTPIIDAATAEAYRSTSPPSPGER